MKTTVLTSDHRLLPIAYRLRWLSWKKHMASEIDLSYIALTSTRNDLVTSTRQLQENGFNFHTALSTAAEISLPKSIGLTRVRSRNNNVDLRKARSQVQRTHHKPSKYSSQHSAALERLDRTHAFVAETHAMAIIDDIQFTTFSSLRETSSYSRLRRRDARYGDYRRHTVHNIQQP